VANPSDQQGFIFTTDATTTSVETGGEIPTGFALEQNYPNPWNPTTTIRYRVGEAGFVSLRLYDALGREVRTLVHVRQSPGDYLVDLDGSGLASGVYLYRLVSGTFVQSRTMRLVK
jgi:hypothetical protein